ncbi:hypothetical protein [Streptomyces venezuelae]|uniref:hypothetical protein n=1 Tax=Streptomyces venezuelae TaxID=54571 RepID=UPI00278BD038|nr:hypothetical protein [Streptomyces venezuelae]
MLAYVIGMSTTEAAWLTTVTHSGMSEAEFVTGMMPAARQAAADHEHLAEAYADVATQPAFDPVALRDDEFLYGLDIVLDGLEARLPR